jgi:hypothetical protein
MKIISLFLPMLLLAACATNSPALNPRAVMDVGGGKFYVEASHTHKAIGVAQSYCSMQGKRMNSQRIVPHTTDEDAAITFTCE